MTKYLIINADDFGIAPGVNRGILELHEIGVVTSTSIIVNLPGFNDAIKRLTNVTKLGIGLHFNLSHGSPISPANVVPSLVDGDGNLCRASKESSWSENDVMIELNAQMERLLSSGIFPSHIDSHGFIQDKIVVCRPIVLLAKRMNIPMRITGWEPALNMPMPLGVNNFYANTYFEDSGKRLLLNNLCSVPKGISELICHPGYVDKYLENVCDWTNVREIELKVLSDPEILATIRKQQIKLINYKHLSNNKNSLNIM